MNFLWPSCSNRVKDCLIRDRETALSYLRQSIAGSSSLLNAINFYVADNPGKRLRLFLALLSTRLCGKPTRASYINAAVVEIIHNATLLHDDVADEADLRRGRLSVQKNFGRGSSILQGDYYVSCAFSLLLKNGAVSALESYVAAMRRMCEGELFQLDKAESLDTSLDDYYYIIRCKTALLFEAAMSLGARSAEIPELPCGQGGPAEKSRAQMVSAIEKAAYHIGMAFQIRDDIFDYMPECETGKCSGTDLSEGKITLPLLGALEHAGREKHLEQVRQWMRLLKKGETPARKKLMDFVGENEGIAYAQKVIERHGLQIKASLKDIPESEYREGLLSLVPFLQQRCC